MYYVLIAIGIGIIKINPSIYIPDSLRVKTLLQLLITTEREYWCKASSGMP